MHLRADIWVSGYLRRCAVEGATAVLRKRGAAEAGAIFVRVDRLDGQTALYGPAPQSELGAREGIDRLWARMHAQPWVDALDSEQRLRREMAFDPDLWIVEVEDRKGRCFLDLAD